MKSGLVLCLLSVLIRANELQYFSRIPAVDYFRQNSLSDCVKRFYRSEWDDLNSIQAESHTVPPAPPPIHGGTRANNGEYKHMAAIGWIIDGTIRYSCGGTLIHPKYVLTAAHCAVEIEGNTPSTVRLGDTDFGSPYDDEHAQQISIKRIKRHPLHKFSRSYHDLALLELESEAAVNSAVCPACLWLEDSIPTSPLHIIGFGQLEYVGELSSTLQQGMVSVVDSNSCGNQFYGERRLSDGLVNSQFCASHETMDTCQGDSGGPIEVRQTDVFGQVRPKVVGVTSFGTACGFGSTGVYTKISPYIDWIKSETNETYNYENCTSQCSARVKGSSSISPIEIGAIFLLLRGDIFEGQWNCSGTLIDDRFVLTSAFCATGFRSTPKFVYIAQNREKVQIDEIIVHPDYDFDNLSNDIALLKLTKYLKANSGLRPLCIFSLQIQNLAFIMNSIYTSSTQENKVKHFAKEILPQQKCEQGLSKNEICAINIDSENPSNCYIYHGGPILETTFRKLPLLSGITAKQTTGCDQKLYGTSIGPHKKWIESVLFKHQRRESLILFG